MNCVCRTLATQHWAEDEGTSGGCRIEWCVKTAREYFHQPASSSSAAATAAGEETEAVGGARRGTKRPAPETAAGRPQQEHVPQGRKKIRLLDVGSCYDPFRRFSVSLFV